MGISIGSESQYFADSAKAADVNKKTAGLQEKLDNNTATDEEMMDAAKSFEAYLLEQVMKEMEKSIPKDEDKNPYLEQFGDMQYEEYAKSATEGQGIGIAKMLYEAMKRNA
jgi:flagellar protein FlgJ